VVPAEPALVSWVEHVTRLDVVAVNYAAHEPLARAALQSVNHHAGHHRHAGPKVIASFESADHQTLLVSKTAKGKKKVQVVAPGPQGPAGPQGVEGIQGATGAQGPQGTPGTLGVYGSGGALTITGNVNWTGNTPPAGSLQFTDITINGTHTVPSGLVLRATGNVTVNGSIQAAPGFSNYSVNIASMQPFSFSQFQASQLLNPSPLLGGQPGAHGPQGEGALAAARSPSMRKVALPSPPGGASPPTVSPFPRHRAPTTSLAMAGAAVVFSSSWPRAR
jgi:hypothetical protein